jgi:eukaryotic-like serine/threonine-protein kinase
MTLPVYDWRELSRLLDAALALPPQERAAWLETLDGEQAPLRPLLRELLTRPDLAETGRFLDSLPRMGSAYRPSDRNNK